MAVEQNKVEIEKIRAESELIKAKRDIIVAEAKSDSWIARSWRPMTMMILILGIIAHQFGIDDAIARQFGGEGISDEYVGEYFMLVTVGVGGYIGGRTLEKGAKIFKQVKDVSTRKTDIKEKPNA